VVKKNTFIKVAALWFYMGIRYFRNSFIEESEISAEEVNGITHFRDTFDGEGKILKHEKISPASLILSTSIYFHHKFYDIVKHFNELGELFNISYKFDQVESYFRPSSVDFNTEGQVTYPIQSSERVNGIEVLESRTIYPDINLKNLSNQSVQIITSKKNALFQPDYNHIRRVLKNRDLTTPLVHGPDSDIFHNDFLGVLAWIRGNYGCDTITLHPTRGEFYRAIELFNENRDDIDALGVNLSYENVDAKNRWFNSPDELIQVDLPFISSTLDISHLPHDVDLMSLEERIFPKLRVVHLNNRTSKNKDLPYREGSLPVPEFLSALKSDGYKGYIVMQYAPEFKEKERDDLERLRDFFS
jgi:sugar phosphate isomerase/epimerase